MNEIDKARLGLLPRLAELAPAKHIGRTALMKYMYFLQTVRGVPLGYNFSMYSYGPFDSNVLADLSSAEMLKIVEITPVEFAGGYGYRIVPGARAEIAERNAEQFLFDHAKDLDWLFSIFGNMNSAELELTSTIVYVDRECVKKDQQSTIQEIAVRVNEIKPHFSLKRIQEFVEDLGAKGVLVTPLDRMQRAG
ncbi:MAG: hypothetical protein WB729_25350 [Candidatus Sulfotelmatobacter sp.]